MLTGLFFLISLIVVALLIRFLHKYQVRKTREIADQTSPLPPLNLSSSIRIDSVDTASPVSVAPELNAPLNTPVSWQEEVRQLRESGKFQEAINLCRRQYPKMLALKQTLVTLRAKLRKENNAGDESLQALYKTALLGDWARISSHSTETDDIYLKLQALDAPEQYWDTLGYKQLTLLTKTDCKLLVKHWGEPRMHSDIKTVLDSTH